MTLEESILINSIVAEIQTKKGDVQINVNSLSLMLNRLIKEKGLNKINSEMIEVALESIKELEPNSIHIENILFIMTYNKSKIYKDLKQYVTDFRSLKAALKLTFFDEDFNLREEFSNANPVLYNLTLEYRKAKDKIIDDRVSLSTALSLDNVLDNIFIFFFLHPSDYEYKYELLPQTIDNIINNQRDFIKGVSLNSYEVLLEINYENQTARQILFAKRLLDQQYQEPIKSTKKA